MESMKTGSYIPKTISKSQASDTGMAILLLLLLTGFFTHNDLYAKIGILVLVINMTFPMFYYPFAIVWLGFSNLLGTFSSKIILTVFYIVLVIPIGVFRRLLGKDSLLLKEFKKSDKSVMNVRNHHFTAKDIEQPF